MIGQVPTTLAHDGNVEEGLNHFQLEIGQKEVLLLPLCLRD